MLELCKIFYNCAKLKGDNLMIFHSSKSFRYILLAFIFSLALIFITTHVFSEVVSKIIARVNNEVILESELQKNMSPLMDQFKVLAPKEEQTRENETELRKRVLDQMIDERIVLQEAKKRSIRISKREVEKGVETVKQRFPSEQDFLTELKRQDFTLTAFRDRIEQQLMILKLLEIEVQEKIVKPTPDEAKVLYNKIEKVLNDQKIDNLSEVEKKELDQLAALFRRYSAERVRARHILVEVKKTATEEEISKAKEKILEIKKQVDSGADFAELAKRSSEDPMTREKGGDLGFFIQENKVPEFEKAAFSLEVGKVSDVIKTDYGFHIIKVEAKQAPTKLYFDDVKNDLILFLARKRSEDRYKKWIEDIRSKSSIKKN